MTELTLPPSPNWYCPKIIDMDSTGKLAFGARQDVHIFNTAEFPPIYLGVFGLHRDRLSAVVLSPPHYASPSCCSASEDGKVKVWHTETKALQHEHNNHNGKITGLSWSPVQEDLIVSGDDKGDLVVWQLNDARIQTYCPEKGGIFCLACSPFSAACVAVGYRTGVIVLVDVKREGTILQRLRGHDEDIQSLVWCPVTGEDFTVKDTPDFGDEGHLLASGSRDKTIRIWSTSKGRQLSLFRVPKPGGYHQRGDQDTGRGKIWMALAWSQSNPRQIISGSFNGDLLLWELGREEKQKPQPFSLQERRMMHNRVVFNLCTGGNGILCSVSMDRQIIFWNIDKGVPLCALPTLGGFVYVAKTSPVDPGRLAIGVGDNMIRVWNLNSKWNTFDVSCLWQGIKTKVTAISWHPAKEGLLAYGTEDGRVGIYDTLSNKPPNISSTYHKKIVYVVAWGPPSGTAEASNDSGPPYVIYSVGDGIILTHNPQKLHNEAVDVNSIITGTNGQKVKLPIRSEVSWSPDFSFVAVGNDDGSVEIYRPPTLALVCTVHVHKKLINSISWHPYMTSKSPVKSPYKHWIATGSNESYIHIVDLSNILDSEQNAEPVVVTASKKALDGHFGRITGVLWSPHIDGQLASVSYDGQARVYDMDTGQVLAQYCRHEGKLLCVVWSGTDPDVIFTGADDFSLHKWRISKHPPSLEEHTSQRRRHPKKRTKGHKKNQDVPSSGDMEGATKPEVNGADAITISGEDKESLESLLEKKKEELQTEDISSDLNNSGQVANQMTCFNGIEDLREDSDGKKLQVNNEHVKTKPTHDLSSQISTCNIDLNKSSSSSSSTNDVGQKEVQRYTKSDFPKDQKKKKPWKVKSFFPVTNKFENKSKESVLEDIVTLAKCIFGHNNTAENSKNSEDPNLNEDEDYLNEDDTEDYDHLGLFLDRRAMYRCLKQEGQHHRDHDNMDYFYQLEIWKGNINGALRLAREREELSDWLVAMAPMAAFDTWITICEDYATQLEADGQYHKAATYLLAAHKVYGAIELFKRHRLFKEAIAIAKVRLSPFDPVLEDLYMLWAHQLTKDGNYEQAAKCHLAMKQVQDAALLLARRYNQSSLQTAAKISLIANEKQQALVYGQKVIQSNLLQSDWSEAYKFLKGQKNLQALLAVAGMHELLVKEVSQGNPDLLSVNKDKFTTWEDLSSQKSFLPDFILDSEVTDPVLPWQPHLIDGHTFPHHILRIWYGNLGITMDTTSIEEMYRALSVLHAGRQVQSEIQQLLVDVSIDLVLCMLSLLMSETPTAITHLLQAVSSLHDAEHSTIMEILLRRFLPQGPKYILKLQQEVTATRVVISMESSSKIDGASKVHTIKRYLSELKEEDSVSNGGLRCRELDCLRAYYYLSILYFLRKRLLERETTATKENDAKVVEMIEKLDLENSEIGEKNLAENQIKSSSLKLDSANKVNNSGVSMETRLDSKTVDSSSETDKSDDKSGLKDSNVSINSEKDSEKSPIKLEQKNEKSSSSVDASEIHADADRLAENKPSDTGAASCDKDDSKVTDEKVVPSDIGASACDKSDETPILPPFDISKNSYGSLKKQLSEDKSGSENDTFILKYHLTISKLSHLSRGLLWDIQGKRYALTETLGYIHKAISQLLLAQRPSSLSSSAQSENAPPEPSTNEMPQAMGGSLVSEPMSADIRDISSPLERLAFDDNFPSIEQQHSCKKRHLSEPAVSPPKLSVGSSSRHHDRNCPIYSRSVSADPTPDNQSFDIHIPHHGHLCVSSTDDSDSGLFDLCSSCELITKSRKVLWEDEPRFPFESVDHGKGKLTSIVNPAKYINVPDEWYNMAADQKYFMPYVTMALLKDEQEYMMHELKRGPDAIQVPFPNPMDSVKILLSMCSSEVFTQAERNQFAEKVISWAMKFSVSTQQKDVLLESLHKIQTHE